MDSITHIRINVSGVDGTHLFSETHTIVYGPAGLLRVPKRFGFEGEDMLCFPSKEEAGDICNKGTPYDVLCASFQAGSGSSIATLLKTAGFSVAEDSTALIWVRADKPTISDMHSMENGKMSVTETQSPTTTGRKHLTKHVRSRMKDLCNRICPRGEDGVMLLDRGTRLSKRPRGVCQRSWIFSGRSFRSPKSTALKTKLLTTLLEKQVCIRAWWSYPTTIGTTWETRQGKAGVRYSKSLNFPQMHGNEVHITVKSMVTNRNLLRIK